MLSPTGALPPQARVAADADGNHDEWSLRYGQWRYDVDDSHHENAGLTYSHDLGAARTSLAFTGAYLRTTCDQCGGWWIAGVQTRSSLLDYGSGSRWWAGLAVRSALSAARYRGSPGAHAASALASLDFATHVSVTKNFALRAALLPGAGFGRISSIDETGQGFRPTLGAALGFAFGRLRVDAGTERIQLAGAPAQWGLGAGWSVR